ncbi:hypothetical protein B188_02100 [Candidatus Brocadiaceae bacterium B188]|nr:hypothetical protein B188_02100 [Candidatus Brocadiaceae bacterium B188]
MKRVRELRIKIQDEACNLDKVLTTAVSRIDYSILKKQILYSDVIT